MSFFSMYITVLYCDIAINKFHLKWSSLEARRAHNFVVIFCENRNLVKGSNPFHATHFLAYLLGLKTVRKD